MDQEVMSAIIRARASERKISMGRVAGAWGEVCSGG